MESELVGEIVAIMVVLQFPPKVFLKSCVSLHSLYGINVEGLHVDLSLRALMTFRKAVKEQLILTLSWH